MNERRIHKQCIRCTSVGYCLVVGYLVCITEKKTRWTHKCTLDPSNTCMHACMRPLSAERYTNCSSTRPRTPSHPVEANPRGTIPSTHTIHHVTVLMPSATRTAELNPATQTLHPLSPHSFASFPQRAVPLPYIQTRKYHS